MYKVQFRHRFDKSLETAALDECGFHEVGTGPGSSEGYYIQWHTIADQHGSVITDAERIRKHPLVPTSIPIYGYVYDVQSGKLIEVPAATEAGKPHGVDLYQGLGGCIYQGLSCRPPK